MLPFDTLVAVQLDTSGDGPVRVTPSSARTGRRRWRTPAVGPTTTSCWSSSSTPTVGSEAEQRDRLAEIHTAAADAVAEATETESRLRVGLETEEERLRSARELHDETLQQLGALQVLTAARQRHEHEDEARDPDLLEVVDTASRMVRAQISGLRHLVASCRPPPSTPSGCERRCTPLRNAPSS